MNPFLEGDDVYVNWPVAQGDLPQARKSAAPEPTKDTSAASEAQPEAREDSMFPTMRRYSPPTRAGKCASRPLHECQALAPIPSAEVAYPCGYDPA
jgi:hypothetical protein